MSLIKAFAVTYGPSLLFVLLIQLRLLFPDLDPLRFIGL